MKSSLAPDSSPQEPPAPPKRTARFDAARRPAAPELDRIVAGATTDADSTAKADAAELLRTKGRHCRPPTAAQTVKERDADAVLFANAVHAEARGYDGFTVNRGDRIRRKSRYRTQGRALVKRLDLHTRNGYFEQTLGYRSQFGNQLTVVRPTALLRTLTDGMTYLATVADHAQDEIVMLKGTKRADGHAQLVEYKDDERTHQYRSQVRFINRMLASADIDYVADLSTDGYGVDTRECFLRRYFTRSSFVSGGRMFGGWWLSVSKDDRLANTMIGGESVVSLDFQSMGARLAYAAAGAIPPEGDLYPTRYTVGAHGEHAAVTLQRDTVKRLFNACLFAESPLQQWPRNLQAASRGVNVGDVIAGLSAAHPALAPLWFTGAGHGLQFVESTILVQIMLRLLTQGITALPVHDCVVVPGSDREPAEAIMRETFEFHTGIPAAITAESAE